MRSEKSFSCRAGQHSPARKQSTKGVLAGIWVYFSQMYWKIKFHDTSGVSMCVFLELTFSQVIFVFSQKPIFLFQHFILLSIWNKPWCQNLSVCKYACVCALFVSVCWLVCVCICKYNPTKLNWLALKMFSFCFVSISNELLIKNVQHAKQQKGHSDFGQLRFF